MTVPTVSMPLAVLLSIGTAVGGAYVALEKTSIEVSVRLDNVDRRIELLQANARTYIATPEFTEVKREIDDIHTDVREIRRALLARPNIKP
jgi:hypothetical protein